MIVVFSCGRTGTNLVLEILRASGQFIASNPPEDKMVFNRKGYQYHNDYLTKSDTVYTDFNKFKQTMNINKDMKIVWTIRDPRDMILSKLYRGWDIAEDGNPKGCIYDISYMFSIYINAIIKFKDRIYLIRMEDVLTNIKQEAIKLSKWTGCKYTNHMLYPHTIMRHEGKRERYPIIDKSQIGLWKNWQTIYDGFFIKNNVDIESLFLKVKPLVEIFGYEKTNC